MNNILYKQSCLEVKDFDESKGIVVAYANVYNNKDSDGDVSAYGSFEKTIKENRKRIRVLKDHIPTISLGVPLELDSKDTYGLLTKTKFNLAKEVSRDMFSDVKMMVDNGLNAELSIGYNVLNRDKKNKSIITEYKLMEYSFLSSWASNELATVQDIKSIKNHYGLLDFITKMYNADYSDTRIKQLEHILKSLTDKEPFNKFDTSNVEPINVAQIINEFTKTLK